MRLKSGNILPLAIIMTLTILMAGIGIGTVVLEGSKRAVETDQSVSAYYMADSGVERQLYEVRKLDKTTNQLASLNENYPNQGAWTFYGGYVTTTEKVVAEIATTSFEVVDIFNPDNVAAAGVDRITVNWANGTNCTGGLEAGLEVGFAEWDISGGTITPSEAFTIQRSAPGSFAMSITLNPAKAYRVRIKSLICTAANVTAQTFNGVAPQGFPGDVTVSAEGTYGKATQKISVTMPKTNVLSGIFSYVIFSECTLLKGTGAQTCP